MKMILRFSGCFNLWNPTAVLQYYVLHRNPRIKLEVSAEQYFCWKFMLYATAGTSILVIARETQLLIVGEMLIH